MYFSSMKTCQIQYATAEVTSGACQACLRGLLVVHCQQQRIPYRSTVSHQRRPAVASVPCIQSERRYYIGQRRILVHISLHLQAPIIRHCMMRPVSPDKYNLNMNIAILPPSTSYSTGCMHKIYVDLSDRVSKTLPYPINHMSYLP